jgi:hypothetical protein
VGGGGQLGRFGQGSVAVSLCTTAYPLYNRFTKRIGASISEAIMRPNPRFGPLLPLHLALLRAAPAVLVGELLRGCPGAAARAAAGVHPQWALKPL